MKSNRSDVSKVQTSSEPKIRAGDLLGLFGLACLIRLLAAWPQQQPNYMDAAYSYVNALNLIAGRGFVEDFVWNYLGQPGLPPQPSHLYWMPLTSLLAWLGMLIGGTSYRAAQIPFVILSALLAPLTYWITYVLSSQRRLSWLAGLLAIFSGFYFPYWTAIDNFTPFALAGSLALLAAWKGMSELANERMSESANEGISESANQRMSESANEGMSESASQQSIESANKRIRSQNSLAIHNSQFTIHNSLWFFLAGLSTALAHLARADGPLLLIVIILAYALRPTPHASRLTSHVSRLLPLFLGYLLLAAPWFIRNWQVTGTLLPSAGSQTIWLAQYDELFSYGRELSAQTFFAQGLDSIWQGRWWVLITNLQTVLAVWSMIFLAPLVLVGGWQLRQHLLLQLAGLYGLLLFLLMTLVFAFPGARGGLFHSGTALLPFICAAAVIGLDRAVDWVAAHRRHWDAALAKQFFGVGLVIMAVVLSCFVYYGRVLKNNAWNSADALYPAIAAWVTQQNPAATVMIGNPPAYRYHGGGLSIIVPNENIETTMQVAHHYHADYLILDHNHPVPLTNIYTQTVTYPGLSLVQTFKDDAGNPIYIFKIDQP